MSFNVTQIKDHLIGLSHSGTLNKVRNPEAMLERSASTFLLSFHPIESMRTVGLANAIHDDEFNYAVPSDFGVLIDLIPQDNRNSWDKSFRTNAGQFDLEKAIRNKTVSIEGNDGGKIIRINWKSRRGKVLNAMDSLTANGTWSAVGSATGLKANSIFKVSGSASIEFDLVATGDGIKNTGMTQVDMTNEDEVAEVFIPIFLPSAPTSISARWGNDLTTKYWTAVSQTTQADGTALRAGWNIVKFPWATATETGTVDPTVIDSFEITVNNSTAMSNIRVDNIVFSIGRNFDCKYYSKYLFKNSAGVWISRTTTDDDLVMLDNDTLPQFLMICLQDMAQQMEGTDAAFDIAFAENRLKTLFPAYTGIYPSQVKKVRGQYGSTPGRGRW